MPRFAPEDTYADSFGFQWDRFPSTQLDNTERTATEEAFRCKTGLSPEDVEGKVILDAGCGTGRFADVVARWGANRIVGTDLSRAVEVSQQNMSRSDRAAIVQADVMHLPFRNETFDVVFSLGVLHHTPSTRASLVRLARLVKPGGILAIWVYGRRQLFWPLLGGEVLRLGTSRMNPHRLLPIVRAVSPWMKAFKGRFPRLAPAANFLLPTSDHQDPGEQVLETFDWYSPRYQWKHTEEEVQAWFHELGYQGVEQLEFPVAVRGRRPEGA